MLSAPASGITSRRSVVKGAAWAVPAVVIASTAPATAMSQPSSEGPLQFEGPGCIQINVGIWYFFALTIREGIGNDPIFFTHTFTATELTHHGQRPNTEGEGPGFIDLGHVLGPHTRVVLNFSATEEVSEGTLVIRYTFAGVAYEISVFTEFNATCLDRGILPWGPPV